LPSEKMEESRMDDWMELTAKDMEVALLPAQLAVLRSAAFGPEGRDPLPELIGGVVRQIRTAVGSSGKFLLSIDWRKIPVELLPDARSLAVERLQTRIPPLRLTADQVRAAENARQVLRSVALAEVAVSRPADPAWHLSNGKGFLCLHRRRQRVEADTLEGL
jgi:hypothetical protein